MIQRQTRQPLEKETSNKRNSKYHGTGMPVTLVCSGNLGTSVAGMDQGKECSEVKLKR